MPSIFFRSRVSEACLALALLLFASVPLPAAAHAGDDAPVTVADGALPAGRERASAVWISGAAYVFGGAAGPAVDAWTYFDDVTRFDPSTGEVTTMSARLPTPRAETAAVTDGRYAYVLGGWQENGWRTDEVVRYDPVADEAVVIGHLPIPVRGASAVWTGDAIYTFGGAGPWHRVHRFDPGTGASTFVGNLAMGVTGASAAWDGRYAYVIGGDHQNHHVNADMIQRYDPVARKTEVVHTLPSNRAWTAAVWDGEAVYVVGGVNRGDGESDFLDEIVRYDPEWNTVETLPDVLPTSRRGASAVFDGAHALVFGGRVEEWAFLDEIVTYAVPPGRPANVTAVHHESVYHHVLVSWDAPATDAHDRVWGYRVHRAATGGGFEAIADVLGRTSFVDEGCRTPECHYRVVAVGAAGDGPASATAVLTPRPPTPPQNLTAEHVLGPVEAGVTDPFPVRIGWEAPWSDHVLPTSGYRVYRAVSDGNASRAFALFAETTETSLVDRSCPIGKSCTYAVTAVGPGGESPMSRHHPSVKGAAFHPTVAVDRVLWDEYGPSVPPWWLRPEAFVYEDANANGARDADEATFAAFVTSGEARGVVAVSPLGHTWGLVAVSGVGYAHGELVTVSGCDAIDAVGAGDGLCHRPE